MTGRWDLTDAARNVIAFRDDRDWSQFHSPKNLASGLVVESAELLELFQWDAVRPAAEIAGDPSLMPRISDELADVLVYALTLAHDLDIDLASAIATKLQDNARRYTSDTYRGRIDKAPH